MYNGDDEEAGVLLRELSSDVWAVLQFNGALRR